MERNEVRLQCCISNAIDQVAIVLAVLAIESCWVEIINYVISGHCQKKSADWKWLLGVLQKGIQNNQSVAKYLTTKNEQSGWQAQDKTTKCCHCTLWNRELNELIRWPVKLLCES